MFLYIYTANIKLSVSKVFFLKKFIFLFTFRNWWKVTVKIKISIDIFNINNNNNNNNFLNRNK